MASNSGNGNDNGRISDEFMGFVGVVALKRCTKEQMERALGMFTRLLDQNTEAFSGSIVEFGEDGRDDEFFKKLLSFCKYSQK